MACLIEVPPRPRDAFPAPMLPFLAFDQFEYLSLITTCHGRTPLTKPDYPSSVANAAEKKAELPAAVSVPVMLTPRLYRTCSLPTMLLPQ